MYQFARYNGYWSEYHQNWAWCSLGSAASALGVPRQGKEHRALSDALTARGVLLAMAAKHGTIDLLAPPEKAHHLPEIPSEELDAHPF